MCNDLKKKERNEGLYLRKKWCIPVAKNPQGLNISNNIVLCVWQDFYSILKTSSHTCESDREEFRFLSVGTAH